MFSSISLNSLLMYPLDKQVRDYLSCLNFLWTRSYFSKTSDEIAVTGMRERTSDSLFILGSFEVAAESSCILIHLRDATMDFFITEH